MPSTIRGVPTPVTSERPATARNATLISAFFLFLLLVAAQIALPLAASAAGALTTTVVLTLASATWVLATFGLEVKQILRIFLFTLVVTFLIEAVGTRFGVPFGHYDYGPGLQPQLASVPLLIPFAWFAMGLPAWEIGRRLSSVPVIQWLIGGLLLAAWDLLLDPQMTSYDFWIWASPTGWYGIPWTNYLGWVLTGFVLCAGFHFLAPRARPNPWLVGLFLWMGGFTALGFLLPFVFDVPWIGVVGGVLTVVPALVALRKYPRPWPR